MKRVAVLGANGQVGSEVCLLLRRQPDLLVVPICRNHRGSAFLRSQGVACRHGLAAEPQEAARLLGDCDLVANFALAGGRPREAAESNTAVIANSTCLSPPGSTIVYFSTQNVYGDPSPTARIRWRGLYGREKLRCERLSSRVAKEAHKPVFVFRLGHVMGELQAITANIRDRIRAGSVAMPAGGARLSNTVYTATIVDALLKVLSGADPPGVYDLMASPQWTWQEVYAYEADKAVLPLRIETIPSAARGTRPSRSFVDGAVALVRQGVRTIQSTPGLKDATRTALAYLPARLGERGQALHLRSSAAAEIAALSTVASPHDALDWEANGSRFLRSLEPTIELLGAGKGDLPPCLADAAFPPDLPDAT